MVYKVKDIACFLNVTEEQVRRWCRNGALKADKNSKKDGYIIREYNLNIFMNEHPKYKKSCGDNVDLNTKLHSLEVQLERMKQEIVDLENIIKMLKGSE